MSDTVILSEERIAIQGADGKFRCRWPGTESAFQVHRLADDALNGVNGLVEYHDHFNRF